MLRPLCGRIIRLGIVAIPLLCRVRPLLRAPLRLHPMWSKLLLEMPRVLMTVLTVVWRLGVTVVGVLRRIGLLFRSIGCMKLVLATLNLLPNTPI